MDTKVVVIGVLWLIFTFASTLKIAKIYEIRREIKRNYYSSNYYLATEELAEIEKLEKSFSPCISLILTIVLSILLYKYGLWWLPILCIFLIGFIV